MPKNNRDKHRPSRLRRRRKPKAKEVDVILVYRDWAEDSFVEARAVGTGIILGGRIIIDNAYTDDYTEKIADTNNRLYFTSKDNQPHPYTAGECWRIETLTVLDEDEEQ